MNSTETTGTHPTTGPIADDTFIEANADTTRIGFRWLVLLSPAAWADMVTWTDADSVAQVPQTEEDRLFELLFTIYRDIRRDPSAADILGDRPAPNPVTVEVWRVPRDGRSTEDSPARLVVRLGLNHAGRLVITLTLPDED